MPELYLKKNYVVLVNTTYCTLYVHGYVHSCAVFILQFVFWNSRVWHDCTFVRPLKSKLEVVPTRVECLSGGREVVQYCVNISQNCMILLKSKIHASDKLVFRCSPKR